MRTQAEIRDEFREMVVPEPGDAWRLQLELLLDIRELLMDQSTERMLAKIAKAREVEEGKRKEVVASKLENFRKGGENADF